MLELSAVVNYGTFVVLRIIYVQEDYMNTFKGIIGGVIGGLVAALPWLIIYVYLNWLFSIAALPIALGVNYGYRKLGGEVNKKLPFIIGILSVAIVCFVTLVIVPIVLIYREIGVIDFYMFTRAYQSSAFVSAILKDLLVGIIFTCLGIYGVIKSTWLEATGKDGSEFLNPYTASMKVSKEMTNIIKEIFISKGATDNNSVLSKEDLAEVFTDNGLKSAFSQLRTQQIIKRKSNGYYWSEKAEKSFLYRFITLFAKMMAIVIPVVLIIILLCMWLIA